MNLSIVSLLVACVVGVIVWLVAQRIPYVQSNPLPVLLGLLAAVLTYLGAFTLTL